MNEYLNQIEISGITYDLVASGGTGSGVTPTEVQEMIEDYTYDKQTIDDKIASGGGESIQILSGDVITLSGDVKTVSGDVKTISGDITVISGDVISLSGDVQNLSGDIITLSAETNALEGKIDTLSGEVIDNEQVVSAALNDLKANKLDASAYTPTDLSNYYKKNETSGKTEIQSALDDKQDVLIPGIGITISGNVISATGGSASGVTSGDVQNMLSAYTYDKDEIDDKLSEVSGDTSIISGDIITISGDVITISGDVNTVSGDVIALSGEVITLSGNVYQKDETSSKTEIDDALALKQDIMSGSTHIEIESGTVINLVIDNGLDSGSTHPVVNSAVTHAVIVQPTSGTIRSYTHGGYNIWNFDYKDGVYEFDYDECFDEHFYLDIQNHLGETVRYDRIVTDDKVAMVSNCGGRTVAKATTKDDWYIVKIIFDTSPGDYSTATFKYGKYGYGQGEASEILHDQLIPDVGVLRELVDASSVDFSAHTADTSIHFTSGEVIDIASGYSYSKEEVDEKIVEAITDSEASILVEVDNIVSGATEPIKNDITLIKTSAVTNVEYDSVNKVINFYDISGTVVDTVDATDFIKDGMIEDVQIVEVGGVSYLRITFNTESGHENIDIDLSQIFDANNYYTKTEVNNIISNKIQCFSEAEWAVQSGSTQPETLYLIY